MKFLPPVIVAARTVLLSFLCYVIMVFAADLSAFAAKWKTKERFDYYTISGTTGRAIYTSIGKNGPQLRGGRRTIAHTTFDLKWRRNYKRQGNKCRLLSAKPFLTITYTVPKVSNKLSSSVARQWKVFSAGIVTHEKVHGAYAIEMVDKIIQDTVGLTVAKDPKCQKIRAEVLTLVKAAYGWYKDRGWGFDRGETAPGGNVSQLVGALVRR